LHIFRQKTKNSIEEELLKEKDGVAGQIKNSNLLELQKHDPLMLYGYGIVAYRDIIKFMVIIFSIITVLVLPVISVYSNGDGYKLNFGK
jgi:hypothetical protein